MKFIIDGPPISKESPRSNGKRFYNPQHALKLVQQAELKSQIPPEYQILQKKPLYLIACFFMPIPKSYSTKKKEELNATYHSSKPDSDNLTKWLKDLGTNIIYKDDALVACEVIQKIYSHNPRTIFSIQTAPPIHIIYENEFARLKGKR